MSHPKLSTFLAFSLIASVTSGSAEAAPVPTAPAVIEDAEAARSLTEATKDLILESWSRVQGTAVFRPGFPSWAVGDYVIDRTVLPPATVSKLGVIWVYSVLVRTRDEQGNPVDPNSAKEFWVWRTPRLQSLGGPGLAGPFPIEASAPVSPVVPR